MSADHIGKFNLPAELALDHSSQLKRIQDAIEDAHKLGPVGSISDGYHTFDELYHHRAMLFASLCLTIFKNCSWKSLLHHDPDDKMYDGMFIVGVDLPEGQASYHYDIDPYWSIFKGIKEVDRAPKFDGHTPDQAIRRIYNAALVWGNPQPRTTDPMEKVRTLNQKYEAYIGGDPNLAGKGGT